MQGIGGFLFLMGAGSFLLNMMDYEFKLLMWIDNWGTGTGTVIRIAMIAVGALLWLVGNSQQQRELDNEQDDHVGPPRP